MGKPPQRILELTEELTQTALDFARADEEQIRIRARESGKKMADQSGGIRNFGIKLNGNFAKPKTSQSKPLKMAGRRSRMPDRLLVFRKPRQNCCRYRPSELRTSNACRRVADRTDWEATCVADDF
jgi:hypothetical protein